MSSISDIWVVLIGTFLSICIFSLIIGDNWLFRLGTSILTGTLSAYICLYLIEKIIYPKIIQPVISADTPVEERILLILVVLSAFILIFKLLFNRESQSGNFILSLMVCISAAIVILSSINGTIPGLYHGIVSHFSGLSNQGTATSEWIKAFLIASGAVFGLLFTRHYKKGKATSSENSEEIKNQSLWKKLEEITVGSAMGSIFAGCFMASAIQLIENIDSITAFIKNILHVLK